MSPLREEPITTSIDITSDQFAKDTTFRTADGKTIRVKHFCVEESTEISLKGLQIGQKVRLRDGGIITLSRFNDDGSSWPYRFARTSGSTYSYNEDGTYWDKNSPCDKDIVEIWPLEAPLVPLGDLPIGSTFRTRGGLVCTLEKSNTPELGSFFGRPPNSGPGGLFYDADGSCRRGNVYDAVEVVTRKESRLSIEGAVKGDIFVLRDGREYTCTGEKVSDIIRTKRKDGCAGLNGLSFNPDGSAYGLGDYADVVKIIPAPKVSIAGAKKGDTFVLRNGRRYIFSGEIASYKPTRNRKAICEEVSDDRSLWFHEDGNCPNRDQSYDVVEFIPCTREPRVALGKTLPVGTEIRLRNGIICQYRGLSPVGSGNHCFIAPAGNMYFKPDGATVTDDEAWEVVEVRKPALPDLVRTQLARLDKADIERIVVNPKDRELFGRSGFDWEGLLVNTNDVYRPGEFVIVFKRAA